LVAVEELFLSIVILLAAARLFGELFRRIGQPALGGELLAGMILGPSLFGIVSSNESLEMLSSIAIFFVLLFIGLEMDIRQVKKTGKSAVVLSITSLILPFAAGYGISVLFGIEIIPSLFIGLLLSVTSVPVSAMILVELGILKSKIGTTVLSAAVVDDIISLVILAVILQFAQSGSGAIDMNAIDWNAIGISGLKIAIFLVGIGCLAYVVHKINIWFPKRLEWFFVKAKTKEATFGILIVLAITISLLAQYADLHFIIGTFFAGLIFSERLLGKKEADHAYGIVSGITFGFFAPLFFAIIGMKFSGQSLADSIPYLLLLIGAAMATKTLGGYLGARLFKFNNIESLALASLLNGRGTVGLAITALAFSVGILDITLYSVAVSICFITTMLTPVLAKPFLRRVEVIRSENE
jgi:Kef-type K+ transport system membrane component KefB